MEAAKFYAEAAAECKKEGKKVGAACAGPWGPKLAAAGVAPADPAACTAAAAVMKKECGQTFATIAAELAAGKISAAEAATAFAAAGAECKEEGKKVAAACAAPWIPKDAADASTAVAALAPNDPDPACAAAVAEMKELCGQALASIAADLAAGKITEAEAAKAFADAAVKCKVEGQKMAAACAGPFGPKPPTHALAATTPAKACAAAAAEMTKVCHDPAAEIADKLKAGKITEVEAAVAFATAAVECEKEGSKVADACAGPWGPKLADAGPFDPECAAAAAEMKELCGQALAAIAADLAAGKITEAEAAKAFAAAAVTCKEEGKKMAVACAASGGPKPPADVLAATTPAKACAAAVAEMKKVCHDSAAAIAAKLKAGKITEVEAAAAFASAAIECKKEGKKVGAACAGPWGPKDADAVLTAAAPVDPAACAAAAVEMKKECGQAFATIAADLAAGTITEAEAATAFAHAANACKKEGKKVAAACAGPNAPVNTLAAESESAKCAEEMAKFKTKCTEAFAKIDDELAAGTLTPKEASKKFAKVSLWTLQSTSEILGLLKKLSIHDP